MEKIICFADNFKKTQTAFRDYMYQYMSENGTLNSTTLSYDKSISFADKEAKINKLMHDEIRHLSGINFSDGVAMEMWAQNPNYRWASFAVVNSLIDMILPDVIDKSIGMYTDTRYGGMGDSFLFEVEPNDLFYVSKAGRDQRTVEFQRQYNTQVSIVPENREITVAVNFYRMLCGHDSLAKFVMKAVLSIEHQITKDVYKAFDTALMALPTTPVGSELKVAGFSQKSAVRLAQTVTAYNHGSKAVFMGTQLALQDVMPDDNNYRYFLDSEYVRMGYIKNAFGFDTFVMPQIADWKNPYGLGLNDDRIYVLSPGAQPLVKLCYEGGTYNTNLPAQTSANLTETTTLNKSYGIGIVTNALAGVITL